MATSEVTSSEGSVDFEGAVLAGGASRRMGTDKAFIEIDDVTLLQGAVSALYDAGATSVIVVGGDAQKVESLGLIHVADCWPSEGPLGGIITALRNTSADTVAVLACDLTRPSAAAITAVREALGEADVSVPVLDGQTEWLHAVWRRSSLEKLERSFSAGERAPKRAVNELRVNQFLDGNPRWFQDADYPDDLPDGVQ
ncbi:MAG: molybdenum cofactor guanylyltransferase [Acidimicrobiaceae bacterium]|nr:molybdenum cofactor guanylyltransferase [Acidimicrobiaceae bacterium]